MQEAFFSYISWYLPLVLVYYMNFASIELTETGNPLRSSGPAQSEARAKKLGTRYEVVGLRTAKLVQKRQVALSVKQCLYTANA